MYLPHRLSQAFELAQFVRHTSRDADLLILTGDFNIEPEDLGYHLIRNLANVQDAWVDRKTSPDDLECTGMTCDRPDNCFTPKALLKKKHLGKRLDYILYQSIRSKLLLSNPLPSDYTVLPLPFQNPLAWYIVIIVLM